MDILVKPSSDNAKRIVKALDEFGFGSLGLTVDDFTDADKVVQLGYPPVRIDFITSLTGVSIDEAFGGSIEGQFAGVAVCHIGQDQFIANKKVLVGSRILLMWKRLEMVKINEGLSYQCLLQR